MNERAHQKSAICLVLIVFLIPMMSNFIVKTCEASGKFSWNERKQLVQLFENSDEDKAAIRSIFFDPRLKKMPVVVKRNVNNKEVKRNYDGFLTPYSIRLANRFARKWRTMLERASQKFEVDREVLVAVLLVETGFGNILGRYPVISVYSSIIVENIRQQQCMLKKLSGCLDLNSRKRLYKKAKWADEELRAIVKIAQTAKQSVFQLKGSYAGAFGIPQFLPSSYLKWGYDSDKNGSVNLFLFPDAIYSTANYLKAHGWRKGLQSPENRNVIWEYNHSQIYVDTIFKVAQKIRLQPPKNKTSTHKASKTDITQNLRKRKSENPS